MTEKVCCPNCKEAEMHEVYYENNKSGLRCIQCDLVLNSETVKYDRQPP